jgi:hypothetical protein
MGHTQRGSIVLILHSHITDYTHSQHLINLKDRSVTKYLCCNSTITCIVTTIDVERHEEQSSEGTECPRLGTALVGVVEVLQLLCRSVIDCVHNFPTS